MNLIFFSRSYRAALSLAPLLLTIALPPSLASAENVPVVDFGDDLAWWCKGLPEYRWGENRLKLTRESVDATTSRFGHAFSLDVPLNPATSEYNLRGNNTRFYGGMMTLAYNSPMPPTDNKDEMKLWRHHWTEGGINMDHDGYDDLNFMGYGLRSKENYLRAFGLWIWKKEDFLNGGDKSPVSFDENSKIAVYISRTYPVSKEHAKELNDSRKEGTAISGPFSDTFASSRIADIPRELWKGWESVDFVVQDGEQFYVAETHFAPRQQTLFEISPAKVKWAKYNPKGPWNIEWDRTKATFETHAFEDIRSVGWMISKPTPGEITTLWLKWYAFGMDAVVKRPASPAWNLDMQPSDNNKALYAAKTPVTYEQWSKIYRWASRSQYALHHGYNFNRDGNLGSAIADSTPHRSDEPLTGITWQDAVLWCNALSEYEGKTPCYYEDAAFSKVLRSVKNRASETTINEIPTIYLRPDAAGYRLPTTQEFASLTPTNPTKLWQFVWDVDGNVFEPSKRKLITVLGGDPAQKPDSPKLPFGEIPSRGHHAIGFLPVIAPAGIANLTAKAPAATAGLWKMDTIPAWSFAEEQRLAPSSTPNATPPEIPLVSANGIQAGKTEVSYAQWKSVWNWAENNGFRFDYDGDIGSLKWDRQTETHAQEEPVTSIGILDAVVWCNALSQMSGLKPVYYLDSAFTQPIKTVHPARSIAMSDRTTSHHPPKGWPKIAGFLKDRIFLDPSATGYRLPTSDDWKAIAGADAYPSGKTLDPSTAWMIENSGQRTHPVGTSKPTGEGFFDLAGNIFEWSLTFTQKDGKTSVLQGARGGSYRSDDKIGSSNPLTNNTIATNSAFQSLNAGIANGEIGFRVIKNSPQ